MASRRGTDPHSLDPGAQEPAGPVPPENEPGHHPAVEQDKPLGRRPRPRTAPNGSPPVTSVAGHQARRFPMAFIGPVGMAARLSVIHEERAFVEVTDRVLTARFGPWVVTTPRSNVVGATVTGPYRWWKVAAVPHLSFSDRGLTFATNDLSGVCIEFAAPVPGIEFSGRFRHPNLTVTVAEPQALVDALSA